MIDHGNKFNTRNEKNNLSISDDIIAIDCYWLWSNIWSGKRRILYNLNAVVWNGDYLFWCDELV